MTALGRGGEDGVRGGEGESSRAANGRSWGTGEPKHLEEAERTVSTRPGALGPGPRGLQCISWGSRRRPGGRQRQSVGTLTATWCDGSRASRRRTTCRAG